MAMHSAMNDTLRLMVIAQKMKDFHADYLRYMTPRPLGGDLYDPMAVALAAAAVRKPAAPPLYPDGPCQRFIDL